jgi:biotin transport system substrate-specific component
MALPDSRRVANRAVQVFARALDSRAILEAQSQVGRDRRRERATGAMSAARVDARSSQFEGGIMAAHDVDRFRPQEVAAFDNDDASAQLEDLPGRFVHIAERADGPAGQNLGFRHVRRNHVDAPHELGADRLDGVLLQKAVATLCHHDGIQDHQRKIELGDCRRHRFDDSGVRKHPDLYGVSSDVTNDGFDLSRDEIGRHRLPCGHAERILRGDRGNGRRAVHAVRGEGLQVRLNARAAARVAPRNCQCCTHTVEFRGGSETVEDMEGSSIRMSSTTEIMRLKPGANGTLLGAMVAGQDLSTGIRAAAVVLIAAMTAAAAQISIPLPFTPVPFTLQPMVVLLGGAALGSRLGMASQILYLAAGLSGLPVFAASPVLPQGLFRLLGPTGGYLLGYPFAACLAGYLAERGLDRRYVTSVIAMAGGLAVVFTSGVAWLAFAAQPAPIGLDAALRSGLYPFLPADVFKILIAATVLPSVWRFLSRQS